MTPEALAFVVFVAGMLVLPGEMVTQDSLPVLEFLEMLCEIGAHYPGFETDIHGLYRQADGSYTVKVLR